MLLCLCTASASLRPSVFKVKYRVETVLVQVVNSSIRCPPHPNMYYTIVTETPHDDWCVSWQLNSGITPTMHSRLTSGIWEYDHRTHLRAPHFRIFGGACPQTPLVCAYLRTHHHQCSPNLKYILPPLLKIFL